MSKAFLGEVSPIPRARNFHHKMQNLITMKQGMLGKSQQFSANLKSTFTVRSALKNSSIEENTCCRGKATVLAIGTAVPPNCIYQSDYPDYYFRVTNSEHISDLKEKFTRICRATKIRKRYIHLTDQMIRDNPNIAGHKEKSLNARNAILAEVPELGKQAAEKALQQWGQSRSQITHLIFHTSSGFVEQPGPDSQLIKLLGLSTAVNRIMLYHNGCFAGGTALRLAKDISENNPGACVLVVCSEMTVSLFRGPSESHIGNLVGQALFADGAAAVIIGSDPNLTDDQPIYEIISARQTLIPDTADAIHGRVTEAGLYGSLSPNVATHIANAIGECISDALAPLGIVDLNSLFWIVHPGGRKILDRIENKLNLKKQKLEVSRHVLSEYGNVQSSSVFFIMEEMRRRSKEERKATTGEGEEYGVLIGFGPGLTVETLVLRALPPN